MMRIGREKEGGRKKEEKRGTGLKFKNGFQPHHPQVWGHVFGSSAAWQRNKAQARGTSPVSELHPWSLEDMELLSKGHSLQEGTSALYLGCFMVCVCRQSGGSCILDQDLFFFF